MFPKMGSCVRERVWVSLVKEASDTGGIPSPLALSSGLGAHNARVPVLSLVSARKGRYQCINSENGESARDVRRHNGDQCALTHSRRKFRALKASWDFFFCLEVNSACVESALRMKAKPNRENHQTVYS